MNPKHLLPAIILSATVAMNASATSSLVYFGTYTDGTSQGIYVSHFDSDTGKLTAPELAAETKNPTFLAVAPGEKYLYAVSEMSQTGAVSAFKLDAKTAKLTLLNQKFSGGGGPCHVSVDATGKCLFAANYGSGSIAALPIHADGSLGDATTTMQHNGSGPNASRQTGPHAHFITPSPDNRFTLDCDLGLDKIFINQLDASAAKLTPANPSFASVTPGSGPRHLTFSHDGRFVYVINEMGGTITVFASKALIPSTPVLTEVQTISTLPKDFTANNTTAEIALHPNGKFLYASNRGHDSLAIFAVDKKTGQLTFLEHQPTLGRTPRHFTIDPSGRWLLAEHQASNSIVVFALDPKTGKLKPTGQTVSLGSPVCAVFVAEK